MLQTNQLSFESRARFKSGGTAGMLSSAENFQSLAALERHGKIFYASNPL